MKRGWALHVVECSPSGRRGINLSIRLCICGNFVYSGRSICGLYWQSGRQFVLIVTGPMFLVRPYFLLTNIPYFLIQTLIGSRKYLEEEGQEHRTSFSDPGAYDLQDGSERTGQWCVLPYIFRLCFVERAIFILGNETSVTHQFGGSTWWSLATPLHLKRWGRSFFCLFPYLCMEWFHSPLRGFLTVFLLLLVVCPLLFPEYFFPGSFF